MTILKTYSQEITEGFIPFNEWLLTLPLDQQQEYATASAASTELMQQNIDNGNIIESVDENGKYTREYASNDIVQSLDKVYNPLMGEFWKRYVSEIGVALTPPVITYTGDDIEPVVEAAAPV